MMPPDLARFLKEEVPRYCNKSSWDRTVLAAGNIEVLSFIADIRELLSALDAAVGLLRQSKDILETMRPFGNTVHLGRDALLATLRLVLGEKETA